MQLAPPVVGEVSAGSAQVPNPVQVATQVDTKDLVASLEADGYSRIEWQLHEKGVRAQRGGKVAIPSSYTKNRVCLKHGNWAKIRHDSALDRRDSGYLILDVAPCVFCRADAAEIISKSPRTESHLTFASPKESTPERGSGLVKHQGHSH